MKFGLLVLPRSVAEVVEVARLADDAGLWAVGVVDSHYLYQDCYPAITAALLATRRVRVGPCVTNCVARSWSIHASSARAHDELAPGRAYLGLGVGDGSVHSIGLRPQRWADLAEATERIRERGPRDFPIHLAASGPRGAEHAGRVADGALIATGVDPVAVRDLADIARDASQEAGRPRRFEVWLHALVYPYAPGQDPASVEHLLLGSAIGTARMAFKGTFAHKHVPEAVQREVSERLARYDHAHHGVRDAGNPNDALFEDRPDLRSFLLQRWVVAGTAGEVRARLAEIATFADVDGVWLSIPYPDSLPAIQRMLEEVAASNA